MLNQKHGKVFAFLGLSLLLILALALTVGGVSVAVAAPAEPLAASEKSIHPPAQRENLDEATTPEKQAVNPEIAEDMRVLFEEMTLVQLLWEQDSYARTACAGNGLNNIQPQAKGSIIVIPNAGDLSVDGSNVSIKLSPGGEITFIPRAQDQRIQVPMDVGGKVEGEEVLSLTLDEAKEIMAAGKLVWTAKDDGPYGNGHGLPGHIAECDPLFDQALFEEVDES
jgi:hypothetical protein